MIDDLLRLKDDALSELKDQKSVDDINNLRVKYLGRKGALTGILRNLGQVSPEKRPEIGKVSNEVKKSLEAAIEKALSEEKNKKQKEALMEKSVDVTLPGRRTNLGKTHPITTVIEEIKDIFLRFGFEIEEGPEIESDYYNFEALNIPKDHPARDMQDTFYITEDLVLRTHTSPVQARTFEKHPPPIKIIAPGRVYRCDSDVSHTPMFHQVEGFLVDTDVTFGHLKGVLIEFIHQMFGKEIGVRFRPSYFPFTEPSAEVDMQCVICMGKGCRVCKKTGWLEILGCGMINPKVFDYADYDTEKYTGFAFGMGVERIAMLKYQITDIRLLFENDIRFLKQF
jgi:phenylalanyl-tRNA synthetase alpha chain